MTRKDELLDEVAQAYQRWVQSVTEHDELLERLLVEIREARERGEHEGLVRKEATVVLAARDVAWSYRRISAALGVSASVLQRRYSGRASDTPRELTALLRVRPKEAPAGP